LEQRLPRPREALASLASVVPIRRAKPATGDTRLSLNEWSDDVSVADYLTADDLAALRINRYPDAGMRDLRDALGVLWNARPEEIVIGNGSMEVLANAFLTYGGSGRTALVFDPTYPLYRQLGVVAGMDVVSEPVGLPYRLEPARVRAAVERHRPSIVSFCSPNNPTGDLIDRDAILAAAEHAPEALVLVDEAYLEYSGARSLLDERQRYPNLAVAKTFSKIRGAAGLRIGALIADPRILRPLDAVRMPWSVDPIAQLVATRIARQGDLMPERAAHVARERAMVLAVLRAHPGLEVFPSVTNFVLFRPRDGRHGELHAGLAEQGVLIRELSSWTGVEDCLRVTIGTVDENRRFLAAIDRALAAVVPA